MGCTQTKHTENDTTLKIIKALQNNNNNNDDDGVKIFDSENSDGLHNALSNKDNTLIIVKMNNNTTDQKNNKYLIYYYDDKSTHHTIEYKRSWSMYSLNIPKKKLSNKN